jgi:hypothetical protein
LFQTVRHWWGSGRGKVTIRLFLFEFVVVLLGVLAAQGLQSWIAGRSEQREGRALLAKAIEVTANVNRNVNYWQRHGQCLRDHVDLIARNAVAGQSMSSDDIGRPGLPNVEPMGFTQQEWEAIDRVTTTQQINGLKTIDTNASNIKRYLADISDQWATLRLLDEKIGAPSSEDRSRVRLATAIIDNRLRWLFYNVGQFKQLSSNARLTPTSDLPQSETLVTDCGLLKDWH